MLTQENVVEIHVLHRQGKSIREIARELDVSRNTVRRYLRGLSVTPSYPSREARPTVNRDLEPRDSLGFRHS